MKTAQVIHNPGAGDGKYDEKALISLLAKHGYECRYFSTKRKGWKRFSSHTHLLVIAGGDGTVRKVVKQILKRKLLDKPERLALMPLGTANNIARALRLNSPGHQVIRAWNKDKVKRFDVGRVFGVPDHDFFLESFGFGVFPFLIKMMEEFDESQYKDAEEHMKKALEVLHDIALNYQPRQCTIVVDGKEYAGRYLMAEVMNTPSIGPNLHISPRSDPGDGLFEVVLVSEKHRDRFANYIKGKLEGKKAPYSFQKLKGNRIKIKWEGNDVHLDDQLVDLEKNSEVSIHLAGKLLDFLVP